MNTLNNIVGAVGLALCFALGGCAGQDPQPQPDYDLIEFGAVAAFTVIINKVEATDEAVIRAYEGLTALENTITDPNTTFSLYTLDAMFANAVPVEYSVLASTGSKLIRSRVRQYMRTRLPDNIRTEHEVTLSVALAIVQGARAALGPKYEMINK